MKKMKQIELLCPAGDLERLKTAVVFGADAVYCGLPDWSLRNPREITFNLETLKEGIEFAHSHGVKVYLTLNVFPHESMLKKMEANIKKLSALGGPASSGNIDGIILSDLGTLALVKKHLPKVEIHVSTQANTLNSEAIKVWKELGAKRIVLAREVTLDEIKEIKGKLAKSRGTTSGNTPRSDLGSAADIELEVFGHGAMCMAYSGRCLLSKYFTGREANLGDCVQSCRWKYKVKSQTSMPYILNPIPCYLEEESRPGDLLGVEEDANGTYFMNSKEICAIDILDKFIESGIDSLKIEGRAKTVYYLATVTRAYRKAIDAYYLNTKTYKHIIKELQGELNLIQNRGYSHGFLMSSCGYEQEYNIAAFKPPVIFLGVFLDNKNLVEVKNKFKVGDKVEIVTPDKVYKAKILGIRDEKGKELEEILTPQEKVLIRLDIKEKISERSILRKKLEKK